MFVGEIAERPADERETAAAVPLQVRVRLFRLSRPEEAALMLPMLRAYHEESPFARFPFSERKALQKVLDSLNRGTNGACFFATLRQRVVGVIDLAVGQPYLSEEGNSRPAWAGS